MEKLRKESDNNIDQNKSEYYEKLVKYNKIIHKSNINKEKKNDSEIKIYPKPSQAPNKGINEENQFLTVISRQKTKSKNDDEIEIEPLEKIKKKTTFKEKKMEENLESKYGKGYKILKMAGYQLGKGLGKEEQGITDPILVKKRKERAGINNDEEYENAFDMGKSNNFILGKKRMNEDKAYEETNEEFKNFDLIIDEYKKDRNNDKKIWELLDEDRRIKKKYYGKGGRFFGFANFRKKFKEDFSELKGKEISIEKIKNIEDDKQKEILAKILWMTKDKIIDKLRQYYENENNKLIYEKVHSNTNSEKNKIASNLEDESFYLKKLNKNKDIYKEPKKAGDLQSIINFIDEYIKLNEINPTLYQKLLNKFSLYCLKITIKYLEQMNLNIKIILDKEKGKQLATISIKIKKLLNNTFNQDGLNLEEDKNDKYINSQKNSNFIDNLEEEIDKANEYYSMFLSHILLNKLIFFIENEWNVQDSKPIINMIHLYSDLLSKSFNEILNKKISSCIISYINKNYKFIPSANKDNLKIHSWIHPLLDILSIDSLTDLLNIIEHKIKHYIKYWSINNESESELLISLLSPWSKLFEESFWKDLYKKFFFPNFYRMFSNLFLRIDENVENIHSIKLLFTLNDKRILPSKKCAKILKKYFFNRMKYFIKDYLRKNKNNLENNEIISKWCVDIINYFKTKNNIYEEIKDDITECLSLIDI